MLPKYEDFTTVEVLKDGDLIIVGEEHGNENSQRLMERILEEVDIGMAAIEKEPYHAPPADGAMGALASYAEVEGIDTWNVDRGDPWSSIRGEIDLSEMLAVANEFSYEVEVNGDLDERAVEDARNRVREQFGDEVFSAVYTDRETTMVRYLDWLGDVASDPPVVAALGAFHVPTVATRIRNRQSRTTDINWDRLQEYE